MCFLWLTRLLLEHEEHSAEELCGCTCCQWPSPLAADQVCCMVGLWQLLTRWAPIVHHKGFERKFLSLSTEWIECPMAFLWGQYSSNLGHCPLPCEGLGQLTWGWTSCHPSMLPFPESVSGRTALALTYIHKMVVPTLEPVSRHRLPLLLSFLGNLPAVLPAASGMLGQVSWSGQTSSKPFCWLREYCWIPFPVCGVEMM